MPRSKTEPIEMLEKRFGYFPKRFRWRGEILGVDSVERCWTLAKTAPQLCFRVTCADKRFDLLQDVNANLWNAKQIQ